LRVCAFHLYVPLICSCSGCATSASLPRRHHSILFSFHPFANIGSAIFKFRAIRFASHKEAHYFTIDHADVLQIYNDVSVIRLKPKKPSQFGYRRFFDPATQDEHCQSPSCLSLNPESHRSGHLANIAVGALCCTLLLPSGNNYN